MLSREEELRRYHRELREDAIEAGKRAAADVEALAMEIAVARASMPKEQDMKALEVRLAVEETELEDMRVELQEWQEKLLHAPKQERASIKDKIRGIEKLLNRKTATFKSASVSGAVTPDLNRSRSASPAPSRLTMKIPEAGDEPPEMSLDSDRGVMSPTSHMENERMRTQWEVAARQMKTARTQLSSAVSEMEEVKNNLQSQKEKTLAVTRAHEETQDALEELKETFQESEEVLKEVLTLTLTISLTLSLPIGFESIES